MAWAWGDDTRKTNKILLTDTRRGGGPQRPTAARGGQSWRRRVVANATAPTPSAPAAPATIHGTIPAPVSAMRPEGADGDEADGGVDEGVGAGVAVGALGVEGAVGARRVVGGGDGVDERAAGPSAAAATGAAPPVSATTAIAATTPSRVLPLIRPTLIRHPHQTPGQNPSQHRLLEGDPGCPADGKSWRRASTPRRETRAQPRDTFRS